VPVTQVNQWVTEKRSVALRLPSALIMEHGFDEGLSNCLHGSAFGTDGRSINDRSSITRQKGDDVGHFSRFS